MKLIQINVNKGCAFDWIKANNEQEAYELSSEQGMLLDSENQTVEITELWKSKAEGIAVYEDSGKCLLKTNLWDAFLKTDGVKIIASSEY